MSGVKEAKALLFQAASATHGIAVGVRGGNITSARSMLNIAKREEAPVLDHIAVRQCARAPQELWLIKTSSGVVE